MTEENKKNNRKNYDKETVIRKLIGKGLKPVYKVVEIHGRKVKTQELLYLESKTDDYNLGIKMLGMVDFLGVPIVSRKEKARAVAKMFKEVEEIIEKKPSSLVRRRKENQSNED
ncbi:MAG: hypothetical protein ACTSPD_09920 [Promethearchaeota archaeon]